GKYEIVANNQEKMLNSLMNQPQSKVVLDRLFKEERATKVRSSLAQIYELIKCIQNTWFQNILSEITEEEWYMIIGSLKVKTAFGISDITYNLIKNASPTTQSIF
ncbi:39689_t:CDS:2, partial [Gigaspora margarita]